MQMCLYWSLWTFWTERKYGQTFLRNILKCKGTGCELPLVRKHGQMFVSWDLRTVLFQKHELLRLHRHFFHPSASKLLDLLNSGYEKQVTTETKKSLKMFRRIAPNANRKQLYIVPKYLSQNLRSFLTQMLLLIQCSWIWASRGKLPSHEL